MICVLMARLCGWLHRLCRRSRIRRRICCCGAILVTCSACLRSSRPTASHLINLRRHCQVVVCIKVKVLLRQLQLRRGGRRILRWWWAARWRLWPWVAGTVRCCQLVKPLAGDIKDSLGAGGLRVRVTSLCAGHCRLQPRLHEAFQMNLATRHG